MSDSLLFIKGMENRKALAIALFLALCFIYSFLFSETSTNIAPGLKKAYNDSTQNLVYTDMSLFKHLKNQSTHEYFAGKDNPNCPIQKHIFYLKVHKTGSTTMTNMIYRFGLEYNLTFATFRYTHPYPAKDITKFILPHPISHKKYPGPKWDIMNQHSVFNEQNLYKILPNDTAFIATIRHPLAHLKSTYNHYALWKHLGAKSVEEFLTAPEKYEKMLPASLYNRIAREQKINISFTKSRMSFEFGFDMKKAESNETYVAAYLEYLNTAFDQVILTEFYDESLVMLRRKLCWSYKDIMYLALRKKSYSGKEKANDQYGNLLDVHKKWASLDYTLYNYFLTKHKNKLTDDIIQETKHYKEILTDVEKLCHRVCKKMKSDVLRKELRKKSYVLLESVKQMAIQIDGNKYHKEFTVTGEDCMGMMIEEGYYHRTIPHKINKQNERHVFYATYPAKDMLKPKTFFKLC